MQTALTGYVAPRSLSAAVDVLAGTEKSDVRVLAGGQSLVPLLRSRQVRVTALVDLNGIPELGRRRRDAGSGALHLGAMVRHRQVAADRDVRTTWSALGDAARGIGDVQVRNRGTIGGNLVHADTASDMPPAVVALDAELHLISAAGTRTVPAARFFVRAGEVDLRPGELLDRIVVPAPAAGTGSAYVKYGVTVDGRPVVGVAAAVRLAPDRSCTAARIVVGGLPTGPVRAVAAEAALLGRPLDDAVLRDAGQLVPGCLPEFDDLRASGDYRRHLAAVHTGRALRLAGARAVGEAT